MATPEKNVNQWNKNPNFLLIVILAGIFLLVGLLAAFFTVDWEGKRLIPRGSGKQNHPTSQLRHGDIHVPTLRDRLA